MTAANLCREAVLLSSEVRDPSEARHLHFMTILNRFYCPVMAYMYTLLLKEAIPFI